MRRARSQLNNLAATASHGGGIPEVQNPLGHTYHTDEVQRRLETTGILPDHHAQNQPREQYHASQMHQGNVMSNQAPYPMHSNNYPAQPGVPQQNYHPAPYGQPEMRPQPSMEMDNIKASLERLTHKLQSLAQTQSSNASQNSHFQQATSQISDQYQNISAEMQKINAAITELSSAQSQNQSEEILELKGMIEQQQNLFNKHIAETKENQIDPNAYATAVEVSHAGITSQVDELRAMLDSAFADLDNAGNSNVEDAVNKAIQSQAELVQRVEQFEANLKGDISTSQNGIVDQINQMQKSLDALESKSSENFVLDTSSLDSHLEEINRAIVALSSSDKGMDNLERIEARISDLGKMLDETQRAPVEQVAPIDADAIFTRFDSVNSAIADLNNAINTQQPGNEESFDGLAAQINKLSEKLDNISALQSSASDGSDNGDNSALLERLDQLVERVETIETPAFDTTIFNSIQNQIGDMSALIQNLSKQTSSEVQSTEDTDAVMEQLKYISSTVYQLSLAQENGEASASDLTSMNELGNQITTLSDQIGNLANVGFSEESLSPISDRLTGIEQQLGASRDIAIEVATQAAQEAVETTVTRMQTGNATPSVDMTPIQQLSEQVQHLRETNDSMNTSNIDTIDTVKDIFSMMAERLSNIESQVMQSASPAYQPAPAAAIAEPAITPSEPAIAEPSYIENTSADTIEHDITGPAYEMAEEKQFADNIPEPNFSRPEPVEPVPNIQNNDRMAQKQQFVNESPSDNDMPIEPGTGGPDLALLVRQAKDRRGGMHPETERTSSSGNQFREIAKQASRVSESEQEEGGKFSDSYGESIIAKVLSGKHRNMVIFGIAALLLIAIAVPLASVLFSGNSQTAGTVEQIEPSSDETTISTPEELSAIQGAIVDDSNAEELYSLSTSEDLIDSSEDVALSSQDIDQVATDAPVAEASAGNSLFSSEATSNTEGFGVNATPAAVEQTSDALADIPLGNDALKSAISKGEPMALFEVGRRYTDGTGVEKNLDEAAKWYERSAESGFAPAQYIIGNFNEKGIGLERNPAKAATWYEAAANNGNLIAMHNLAVLYATPGALSEQPDMARAFEWFKKAAVHGVRDSQVNAGIFHTNGAANGETNLVEAYKWFAVAGAAGDKDAISKREVVGNAMRPDQLEEAKKLAAEWKPAEIDREANEVSIPEVWKDVSNVAAAAPAAFVGDKSQIKLVQATLSKLGFDAGPADGVMGQRTRNAISAFQRKIGMPQSGEVNAELLQVLKQIST